MKPLGHNSLEEILHATYPKWNVGEIKTFTPDMSIAHLRTLWLDELRRPIRPQPEIISMAEYRRRKREEGL